MVLSLSDALEANYVFIGKLVPGNRIETAAISKEKKLLNNFVYSLTNTPCEKVIRKEGFVYIEDISLKYSRTSLFVELGIKSYMGIPIYTSKGIPIGVLVAMYNHRNSDPSFVESIFKLFVSNIGSEVERFMLSLELKESEVKFKQFFNKATDPIFIAAVDTGKIVDANEKACQIMEMSMKELLGMNQWNLHPAANERFSKKIFNQHVQELKKGAQIKVVENYLLTKSGKQIPVEINASFVKVKGKTFIMGSFRDITERKRTGEQLVESERKYKAAFITSPDAVLISNFEGTLLDVNDGFVAMSGYAKEEVEGKTVFEIKLWNNTSDRKVFLNEIEQLGECHNFETQFRNKNGKIIHALISAKLIFINEQKHILTIARDITARKKMEQQMLENEQLLNTVLESAPYIIVLLNQKLQIVKLNLTPGELLKNHLDFKDSSAIGYVLSCFGMNKSLDKNHRIKQCSNCQIRKIIRDTLKYGMGVYKKEVEILTQFKSITMNKYYLVSSKQIIQNNNKLVLLTLDDITSQKQIEEDLMVSKEQASFNEKRYSLLADLTFEGIILQQNNRIIDVNKAIIRMTDYSKNELIGAPILELLYPEQYYSLIKSKMQPGYVSPFEVVLRKKNGTLIPVEVEAKDIQIGNKKVRAVAIRDITERKETEKMIMQAIIKSEEAQKNRFAQELHDGLGPVLSNVQMYFQWMAEEDENKEFVLEKGLSSLKTAFSTLREISNNLSPHILHDFGLVKALIRFIDQLPVLDKQIIHISSSLETGRFDHNIEVALYRVITELINNSRKYAQASKLDIKMEESNGWVLVKYMDNGRGFNFEEISKRSKGQGLLNMKNRIETLNGEFLYKTAPGKGINVHIKTPKELN